MSAANNGGPAFPVHGGYEGDDPRNLILGGGVSLRDYFAAKAPEPQPDFAWADGETDSFQRMTRWAYVYADAMLRERVK